MLANGKSELTVISGSIKRRTGHDFADLLFGRGVNGTEESKELEFITHPSNIRDNAPELLLRVHRRHELVVDEQSSRKFDCSSRSGDLDFDDLSHGDLRCLGEREIEGKRFAHQCIYPTRKITWVSPSVSVFFRLMRDMGGSVRRCM